MKEYFGDRPEVTPLLCKLALHEWALQTGFARFYFCNRCGLINRDMWT